jgi:hypothetical protein
LTRCTLIAAVLAASAACAAPFAPQYVDGTRLLSQYALDGGFAVAVYGPVATTPNQTTTLTVQIAAPTGGRVVFGLVAIGYEHTAAGMSYGAFPYGSYCPLGHEQSKQLLTSSPAISWVSPIVMLAPPTLKTTFGAFIDSVIVPNVWLDFPKSTPFPRANDYDWQGACFVSDETVANAAEIRAATGGASAVAITCPLLLRQADASIAIWLAIRAAVDDNQLKLTKYLPVTLTANPSPVAVACPAPTQAPVVTSPREGDRVGPNFDVIGTAQACAVVVISTDVIAADTGELLKSVPGHRHLPDPSGAFNLRIAAPRMPDDYQRQVRYRVHIRSEGASYKSPETVVNVYPQPAP